MGEVYKARDRRLDRMVAVKVMTAALASDSDLRARFEQEARAIAALNHPHICTIHDVGRHGEVEFLVMELDGETLAQRIARGPLPVADALTIARRHADGRGVHRNAGTLSLSTPAPLFQTFLATGTNVVGNKPQYAVSRDGRFLVNAIVESPSSPVVVTVNWNQAAPAR
jgi:serine/threonine protein kinase